MTQKKYLSHDGLVDYNEKIQNKIDLHTHDAVSADENGFMISSDKVKLDGIENNANNYTLPVADTETLGGIKSGSNITNVNDFIPVPIVDGIPYYKDTTYTPATQTKDGLILSVDKTKLDNIEEGANKTIVDVALSDSSENPIQNKAVTSALDERVPVTRTINNKPLSSNVSLTAEDVGADASGSASNALIEAKSYIDSEITDLINGAPTTRDTLKEIADAMAENDDIVEALHQTIGTKANTVHEHSASDITSGTISILQGGTGATDRINALENLIRLPENTVPEADTVAKWAELGTCVINFDKNSDTTVFTKPSTYGTLIQIVQTTNPVYIQQIWLSQGYGVQYNRAGNSTGWLVNASLTGTNSWRKHFDNKNIIPIANGGTNADNVVDARVNLGLDSTVTYEDSTEVSELAPIPIGGGGTGATTADEARSNLDVYSKSEVNGILNGVDAGDLSFDDFTDTEINQICDFEAGVNEEDVLPIATDSLAGCVVVGDGLNVDADGVLSNARGETLLWTNASPTSAFASQTISLDLSEYDYIRVSSVYGTGGNNIMDSIKVPKGRGGTLKFVYPVSTVERYGRRNFGTSATGVFFENAVISVNGADGAEMNDLNIPYLIYGIKGGVS